MTASAPDRSTDDTEAGVASASEQPDSERSEPSETPAGVASASEQPESSDEERSDEEEDQQ